jgi:uncharacterized protein (DUF2252 family)
MDEILKEVLAKMPKGFSTNQFNLVARKRGLADYQIENFSRNFLHENCTLVSGRTWLKKDQNKTVVETDIQQAINLLKSKGYKVMKPTTNYEEV